MPGLAQQLRGPRAGPSVESRLRVVAIRAIYLDELERRAGAGFQAWIGSGARAAGDPSRYVDRHRRHLAD